MKQRRIISLIIAMVMSISIMPTLGVTAESEYKCNFMSLVKNGADTTYGTSADIIQLDEYTTAYLTYEGTYVSADGKVYLKSGTVTNGAGKYKKGSYIAFTAPADGTVSIKGADMGICIGDETTDTYVGYEASGTHELTKGQMLFVGYRKISTYISELTFTPSVEPTASPTATPSTSVTTAPSGNVLYEENFETYSNGDAASWTSPAGTMSIKTDATPGINKYQTVVSGKSGTCRSGYIILPSAISKNFVFECDFKSTSDVNVSDLELLENKSSVYANHGRYSNAKYAFTMARPKGSDLFVINNEKDDSNMVLDSYEQPAVVTKEIANNTWVHVKVIGNFDTHTAIAYITSLDGSATYYHGMTDMSPDISSWQCLHLLSPSTGADTCIDNIRITEALSSDLDEVFHTVTINDGINEFSQYVANGESVVNIPDISVYGEYFEGWVVDGALKSSDELAAYSVTKDMSITAQISDNYIENLASVEFNVFPTDNQLKMGADVNTYADNEISLKILGEKGTSLVSNPDSRVTDYKIEWKFDGFRTLDGNPTHESGSVYCDSYGLCEVTETAQTSVNFKLKNTAANYYGTVTAVVTYNGKTMSVSKPLVLLADTSTAAFLPKAGYTSDFNKYEATLVGYDETDGILTGGYLKAGSDVSHITLASDSTGKYLELTRDLSGNSSYIYNTIGNITSQTVFSQDIRFGMDANIAYGTGKAVTEFSSTAFELSLSDSGFDFNGSAVCSGEKNKWYHIEITADPTTKRCFAKIYNLEADGDYSDATPVGTTAVTDFMADYTSGNDYRITLAKDRNNSVDINNIKVVTAQLDESSITVTAPETISIPQTGIVTENISVTAKTVEGDDAIGMASWSIDDEAATGVSIVSNGNQSAVLTVDAAAASGEIPVKVTINNASQIKKIRLIGTSNNVAFNTAPTGVMIPASGSAEYQYDAELRNGNGDKIDDIVTYTLYNSDNTSTLNADGISISDSGVLRVTSSAEPQDIYIRATSGEFSKSVKVSVYSLKFSFGTATPQSGYTRVDASTGYSDSRGYGITGTATDNTDKLSGSDFGFKLKLEKGNVYKITAKYKGTIKCERIDTALSGFERSKDTLETDTFNTAVFGDGVLDITLSGAGEIASITVEKVESTPNAKPAWWTIGDSTVQQNGSWAHTLNNSLTEYTKLNNAISSFHNSGQAGRQHKSYYTEGLLNNVLCSIMPGDVVSISGMGTNDSSSTKEQFADYTNIYIDAIIDMGGKVILGSYTPTGNYGATEGKVYDSDNIAFKGVRTNIYDTAIREVYEARKNEESILGFIDIGQIADNLMTNDVRTVYNNAYDTGKAQAQAAADARAEVLMAMWKDYNHYYIDFSNYILPELTTQASQLILGEVQNDVPAIISLKGEAVTPSERYVYAQDGVAIIAEYDGNKLKQIKSIADVKANDAVIEPSGENEKVFVWNSLEGMKPVEIKAVSGVKPTTAPTLTPTATPTATNTKIAVTSSDEYIDVSSLEMYGNSTYRIYSESGTADVTAENNKVHNTTNGEVTVVPVYRFEFTNQTNPTDANIKGYVKVGANSYTEDKGYGLVSGVDYSINENGCKPVSGNPIKVDVPNGYYDITVYRKGGARADVYSDGVQILNNTTSSSSQNRPSGSAIMYVPGIKVENGGVDITFGNTSGNNERIASLEVVYVPDKYRKSVIWVAGDSESANYYPIDAGGDDLESDKIMMTGFGMQLSKFLSDKYNVANWGQPSATAQSWNAESLDAISTRMQKGDTILIDFGINDGNKAVGVDNAKENIKKLVDAAKLAGATPILVSPVYNSKYQHKTYFTYNKAADTNDLEDFANELGVSFIDLNRHTMLYVEQATAQTGDAAWITNNYHVGDNLHMTQHSALLDAAFICAEMKKLGYETTDFAYTYKDISSINDGYIRGTKSGITRVYSVSKAEKFIADNASPEEVTSTEWDFATNQTATSGVNVPVISGTAVWSEDNQNIKFDANDKTTGEMKLTLDPAVQSDIIKVNFDMNVASFGGQTFSYEILDNEGNSLVTCSAEVYNAIGALVLAGTTVAEGSNVTGAFTSVKGDGMSAAVTSVSNEINFKEKTITVIIGSKTYTGQLTGSETGAVAQVNMKSERTKTADRSIYVDNLAIKGYKVAGSDESNETSFPEYAVMTYTAENGDTLPYRIYTPGNVTENMPVVVYLHGETRKGSDNEGQMYNAKPVFDAIKSGDTPCILVAPQCDSDSAWTDKTTIVSELVSGIENAEDDRIYIAGYSEGASACYDMLETGIFAAALPISGTGDTAKAQAIANTNASVMAFNGSEEDENAREMIKALIKAGSKNAEYSEVYGEGSNIQDAAVEMGAIEWLLSKSITLNASEENKKVDLAIFMGQSNMAGRGEYEDAITCKVGHGYEFRSVTEPDMLFNVTGPFGKLENNDTINDNSGAGVDRRSGDMVSSLMESYYQTTGVPLVGVQCSRGGTNLGYWTKAAQQAEAQKRLGDAKTYLEDNGYEIGHIFMVWCQGEADGDKVYSGSQTVDGYKSGTLSVFEYMKSSGVTDMFIVQTGHYNGTDDTDGTHDAAYVAIHDAQAALAEENDNVYTVGSFLEYQSSMKDSYHFHQNAYNEVGTAAGEAIAQVYTK